MPLIKLVYAKTYFEYDRYQPENESVDSEIKIQ